MRTRNRIICIIFALFGLLLDTSVIPFLGFTAKLAPRMCLTNILVISIVSGSTEGMIVGAICGYLGDITVYYPVGLIAVSYTLCAFAAGFMSRRLKVKLVTVLPPAVIYTAFELAMLIYSYFTTGQLMMANFLWGMLRMLVSFVLIQLLYIPAVRILKPARIGRTERRTQRGK